MIFTRWVGSSIDTPSKDRGLSPIGRQTHYGAVELAGDNERLIVNVNDIVVIADPCKSENDEYTGGDSPAPRLAQVLSMWEDVFTGLFKFHARWLERPSDLPKDALVRLQAARRAFGGEGGRCSGNDAHEENSTDTEEADIKNEVFLTTRTEDLDVRAIANLITLAVPSEADEVPAELDGKLGPRLTHYFDEYSGDFTPVDQTEAVVTRARARHTEVVARASMDAEGSTAASSGMSIIQSSGWLLPRRRTTATARTASRAGSSGAGSTVYESEGELSSSGDDSGLDQAPKSDDLEWQHDDDNASTDTDYDRLVDPPPRKSNRQRALLLPPNEDGDVSCRSSFASPPTQRQPLSPRGTIGVRQKRPRRLAMPPAEGGPSLLSPPDSEKAVSAMEIPSSDRRAGRMRKAPAGARGKAAPQATMSLLGSEGGPAVSKGPRPSITGKRKRGRPPKVVVEDAEESDYPPRSTNVGDSYQVEIPDLLSARDREMEATHAPLGACAKMVWRSIRDWDPHSRGMLSAYLDAAKKVVKSEQSRPGVAVHVRLGGDSEGIGTPRDKNSVAGSYAVWAVTADCNGEAVRRVACSEMAQTEVPVSAIQSVQSDEEALAALVKARCTLDDFGPALKVLANDDALPESLRPWTLQQVRTLERVLEKDFDLDRRLHGWARDGMDMDREDFIDLADVAKQVPGKDPTEVLSFYHKYLAAAQPLTDVVYGREAAKSRRREPILPARGTGHLAVGTNSARFKPTTRVTRTASPAVDSRRDATHDSPTKPNSGTRERGDVWPPKPTVSPPPRSTVSPAADPPPAGSGRAAHGGPSSNGSVGVEHGRQRTTREQASRASRTVPPDVEVLEVDGSDDGGEDGSSATRTSTYDARGFVAAMRARHMGSEGHARHPADQARGPSWGPRPIRPRPVVAVKAPEPGPGHRRYPPPTERPAAIVTAPYGHRTGVVMSCSERQHQQQRLSPAGCAVGDGHDPSEAARDQQVFGFMGPCWRLLERAQGYMDPDQLLYMRGLILTHVRKPMTRDQLLERAKSCLQKQQHIFAAFVKMFDRVDHIHAEASLVPLYAAARGSNSLGAMPMPMWMPMSMPYRGRGPVHRDSGSGPPSSYSRDPAPMPRVYAVPPGAMAMRARSDEPYPSVPAAEVDVRRQPLASYVGGWESHVGRAYRSGGDAGPPRRPAATPHPTSSPSSGSTAAARPGMMFREDARDRGEAGARALPPQQQRPRDWRADGGPPPSPSIPPIPPEAHASGRRVHGWAHRGAGGWS